MDEERERIRDFTRTITLNEPIAVKAAKDGIWGFEDDSLIVTKIQICVEQHWYGDGDGDDDDDDYSSLADVQVTHEDCEGMPYTDSGIEKGITELLNQYLPQVKWDLHWTEHGMQCYSTASLELYQDFTDQELTDMKFVLDFNSDDCE